MESRPYKRFLIELAVIVVFTLFQVRLLWDFHQYRFNDVHTTTFLLLDGHPYLKAFQNRLLGPALIEGFHAYGLSQVNSVCLFSYVFYMLHHILLLVFLRKWLVRREGAPRETLLFMGIYTFLMYHLS